MKVAGSLAVLSCSGHACARPCAPRHGEAPGKVSAAVGCQTPHTALRASSATQTSSACSSGDGPEQPVLYPACSSSTCAPSPPSSAPRNWCALPTGGAQVSALRAAMARREAEWALDLQAARSAAADEADAIRREWAEAARRQQHKFELALAATRAELEVVRRQRDQLAKQLTAPRAAEAASEVTSTPDNRSAAAESRSESTPAVAVATEARSVASQVPDMADLGPLAADELRAALRSLASNQGDVMELIRAHQQLDVALSASRGAAGHSGNPTFTALKRCAPSPSTPPSSRPLAPSPRAPPPPPPPPPQSSLLPGSSFSRGRWVPRGVAVAPGFRAAGSRQQQRPRRAPPRFPSRPPLGEIGRQLMVLE